MGRAFVAVGLLGLVGIVGGTLLVPTPAAAQESRLSELAAAAKTSPSDPSAALALGRALRRAGRETDAVQELKRGTRIPSARAGEVAVELRWELARAFVQNREFEPAMASCRAVGAVPGAAVAGHACAAEAHLLQKRASEALDETSLALAGGARSYEAKVAEGLAMELEGKDESAEAALRESIAWKADAPGAHAWLGRLLVRTLRHDEGVTELRRAVALDPTDPELAYELALTLPAGPEAEALLQGAVSERPSFERAWLRLANVRLDRGELAPAAVAADASFKADPHDAAAAIVVGRVALESGRDDDALRAGQAALALVANSARARLLVADAYAKKGEIELAIESYEGAFGLDESDPTPLVRASEACHREGRDTSARAFARKATQDFPAWAPGWVAYGEALSAEKDYAAARTAYEAALKASGPIDAAAVQKRLSSLR